MEENNLSVELMKADKWSELSELMHKSITKVNKIKVKTREEHHDYKKQKKTEIANLEKEYKLEKLRITEEKALYAEQKSNIETKLNGIDELVYQDTIEQHQEKHKLEDSIEDLNGDIEELERLLERKKKEREMLILEKEVHERSIQQARMKYSDKINRHNEEMEEVTTTLINLDNAQ